MLQHTRRAIVTALAVTGTAACAPQASPPVRTPLDMAAYERDTQQWRVTRLDAIAGPDGWSTVAGLVWLDSATYTVGTAASSGIALPAGHAAATVGTFTVQDSTVHFTAAPRAAVLVDSLRVDTITVTADKGRTPMVLRTGSVTLRVIERGGRRAIRVKDSSYVLRTDFKGLDYFPLDTALRVIARLVPHATPRTVRILNVIGQTEEYASPGTLEFTIRGRPYRITATYEGRDTTQYFLIFRDSTSRTTTYPAGRFMYAAHVDSTGTTVVDFNRAYNPPCAFTPFATCPLPPPENTLPIALVAGEKRYTGPHGATLAEVRRD